MTLYFACLKCDIPVTVFTEDEHTRTIPQKKSFQVICLCINTSLLFSDERLAQFTIYGSNETYDGFVNGVTCAYRQETVGISLKINCTTPVMAR